MTLVRKLTQSAAVAGVTAIMSLGGFVSGATTQSPQAITTLAAILGVGTVGVLIAGVLVSFRFRLTPATHAILMDEIERLRSGDTSPPDPAHRAVVEDLTGWRYDQLWGNNPVAAARP